MYENLVEEVVETHGTLQYSMNESSGGLFSIEPKGFKIVMAFVVLSSIEESHCFIKVVVFIIIFFFFFNEIPVRNSQELGVAASVVQVLLWMSQWIERWCKSDGVVKGIRKRTLRWDVEKGSERRRKKSHRWWMAWKGFTFSGLAIFAFSGFCVVVVKARVVATKKTRILAPLKIYVYMWYFTF